MYISYIEGVACLRTWPSAPAIGQNLQPFIDIIVVSL